MLGVVLFTVANMSSALCVSLTGSAHTSRSISLTERGATLCNQVLQQTEHDSAFSDSYVAHPCSLHGWLLKSFI